MKSVFLSHITEEAKLAVLIKDWVESTFSGHVGVFVSSSPEDIAPGENWLTKIDGSLDKTQLLIILCSPASVLRPWINFEAGCGWIKRVPILPICHSGQSK